MSYLADIYRNFDAHFAEENASMVSFPNCTEIGSIVVVGCAGSGKMTILGQLSERFKTSSGSMRIESDIQRVEIRNVIFKIPIIDCPESICSSRSLVAFENCKAIVVVIDSTSDLPIELLSSINEVKNGMSLSPEVHIFLNKTDLLDQDQADGILNTLKTRIKEHINSSFVHYTSTSNGTALLAVSQLIESLLPKQKELRNAMRQFATSLELTDAFLVDLQSKTFLLSSGVAPLDPELFTICQDGIDMFVGIATMMDARSAQSVASVELKDGTFMHFFWSTYDVILVGISDHHTPSATAKNNVLALLHSIKRTLK